MKASRSIAILGSTGSIGRQTLDVAGHLGFAVRAIAARSNVRLLEQQARKFNVPLVAVCDEAASRDLKARLADTPAKVLSGAGGLLEAASEDSSGTVVSAIVGTAGLRPTLAALEAGKRVALANKEALVCAGTLVMSAARKSGAEIIPVDSEHSAIFQCLEANRERSFKRLVLTASGGPFRGKSAAELKAVTLKDALAHPTWSMGPKITVDSATLMNKGLEFIEAMHLFCASPDQIEVVVHPQSVVHSLVEFCDGSVLAQMSMPDMRLPIQYALTYPQRLPSQVKELRLAEIGKLTFEAPDTSVFRCLGLAMSAARTPGTACAVLNAANEAAVALFLQEKIPFCGIPECVRHALETIENKADPSIEDILAADAEAKRLVFESYRAVARPCP